jgi:transcription elongation factor GreA
MTAAQKAALEAELAELEGPRRTDVVQAIKTAREFGDLSENFEYHAAKNEQGLLESRIRVLRDRLERAVVIDEDAAAASGEVAVGSIVEVEDDSGERTTVEISSVTSSAREGVQSVSPQSPLGRALIGARPGDTVDVQAPRGSWRARVLSIGR